MIRVINNFWIYLVIVWVIFKKIKDEKILSIYFDTYFENNDKIHILI